MKPAVFAGTVVLALSFVVPALRADVKTTEKSTVRFEGFMGAMLNRMGGGANGVTTTVAVRGNRMSRMSDNNGLIIDVAEEKFYNIDVRRKEYTEMTFAELREQMAKARAELEKQQAQMNPEMKELQEAAKNIEFDVSVKPTGQARQIAGHTAREHVVTIAMRQQGQTLESGGGMVVTSNVWMGPRVAALDELMTFNMKVGKALFGDAMGSLNPQQINAMASIIPGLPQLMQRLSAETDKLEGTALATTTVFESVKSPEQMKGGGSNTPRGGLGGILGRMGGRGKNEPRSKVLTMSNEYVSVSDTATDADVAIPATFKLKK